MRSSAEQMQLLALLIELTGAERVLEIGCFTGYGSLAMALALPPEGRVVTLDVNEHWPAIGRRHWERAGVADRIELRLGWPQTASSSSPRRVPTSIWPMSTPTRSSTTPITSAPWRWSVRAASWHSTMCSGVAPWPILPTTDHQTLVLRALNAKVRDDARVASVLLPVGDGVLLARRR